jgi:hypothetical protein
MWDLAREAVWRVLAEHMVHPSRICGWEMRLVVWSVGFVADGLLDLSLKRGKPTLEIRDSTGGSKVCVFSWFVFAASAG